jgi:glutamate synthase (NADPH/NADH) small chain
VVGSGPAGLAAAQQLTRAGHDVTVFERADRIGGLLRYGIPEFKMEKRQIDRRVNQMETEGTVFRTNTDIGTDITVETLMDDFDAVVLAGGATRARDLPIPGRELVGIYQAMEYLPWANRAQMGDMLVDDVPVNAKDKKVVIIGGGDTGADCLGTAHRQGAAEIQQFEIMPQPPQDRSVSNPWPTFPMTYKVTSAHEEGGERLYSVNTEKFLGDDEGNLRGLAAHEVEMVEGKFQKIKGSDFEIEADLVFLAMGFTGPEDNGLFSQVGISLDDRSNVVRNASYETNVDNIWVCGDMGRGQSLIVWAIAEGRSCAAAVDLALSGSSTLPIAIQPTDRPLS